MWNNRHGRLYNELKTNLEWVYNQDELEEVSRLKIARDNKQTRRKRAGRYKERVREA